MLTETLKEDFNKWLESNGHHPWSMELFAERFGSHSATVERGVEARRTKAVKVLSHPPRRKGLGFGTVGSPQGVPAGKLRVWLGLKFIDGTFSQKGP